MKFKFSLAPVLKVRKHQEKLQKQKLAEQVSKKQKISDVRDDVQGKLKTFLQNSEDNSAENIHMIRRRSAHLQQVHQKMDKLSRDLDKAEVEVSKEREKLATAYKNLHILEKVKEFEKGLFSERMAKDEQKFMDEIATQSFSR
ncbi:MAG: flagellar export protein FliJ [Gracilimonas sp.]|uniref:flagellar export protein FliJ n=1 Tax=Gracilimonas TaxID=649462 RepID=UPI001B1C3954|nr:flagellar export protein FliJ [Gracilimonas sp.]MBO6586854.1 flagellar export protein FliJ [Gracilimonas sp.]MBO6614658.1 flagellar export protein FliJ [Gracilimonas sp.]